MGTEIAAWAAVKWDTDFWFYPQSDRIAFSRETRRAQGVGGLVPTEILPKLAEPHSGNSSFQQTPLWRRWEAKPFVMHVLEPKQVIDFVQLASLVIRVGISDNSGSKTSKPSWTNMA